VPNVHVRNHNALNYTVNALPTGEYVEMTVAALAVATPKKGKVMGL
jgi:hypothetical protein